MVVGRELRRLDARLASVSEWTFEWTQCHEAPSQQLSRDTTKKNS